MVRISKMEIMGRKRMNRKSSDRNSPIVPRYVAQSQRVGVYIPQEEGRKSRCRLVTTMTKRSSHIPMLTMIETTNSTGMLERILRDHSTWGATPLHRMSVQ